MTTTRTTKSPAKTAAKATAKRAPAKRAAAKTSTSTSTPPAVGVEERPRHADLPLEDVVVHPRNVRKELREMDELADSIREIGVLQPVVVAPHPGEPGRYWLIAGHRRREGSLIAGRATIPATIRWDLTAEVDVLTAMAVENLQRVDLTEIEEGVLYEQLSLLGLTDLDIARRTGRRRDTVERRRHLLDLPENVRDKVQHRQITLAQAEELATFADDPQALRALAKALDKDATVAYPLELNKQQQRRETARKRRELLGQLEAMGVTVVPDDQLPPGRELQVLYGVDGDEDARTWRVDRTGMDQHAVSGCPGRPVATVSPGGWVVLGCLDPSHDESDADPPTPGETGTSGGSGGSGEVPSPGLRAQRAEQVRALAAEREADERKRQECSAAAAVREAFVRELIGGQRALTPPMRDLIVRHVALAAVRSDEPFWGLGPASYADWMGLDGDLLHGDDDELETALAAAVTRVQDPVRALLAAVVATEEPLIAQHWHWNARQLTEPGGSSGPYLRLLADLGYAGTPWETARLEAAQEALAAVVDEAPAEAAP